MQWHITFAGPRTRTSTAEFVLEAAIDPLNGRANVLRSWKPSTCRRRASAWRSSFSAVLRRVLMLISGTWFKRLCARISCAS